MRNSALEAPREGSRGGAKQPKEPGARQRLGRFAAELPPSPELSLASVPAPKKKAAKLQKNSSVYLPSTSRRPPASTRRSVRGHSMDWSPAPKERPNAHHRTLVVEAAAGST
eukprot:12867349-Alexandrium_andersonii.AAC.1